MKKKLLSLAMALVICLGLCAPAYAAPLSITPPTGDMTITLSDVISEGTGKISWEPDKPIKIYTVPAGSTLSAAGDEEHSYHWYFPAQQISENEYTYDDGNFNPIPSTGIKLDASLKDLMAVDECSMLYVLAGKEQETEFLIRIADSAAAPSAIAFTDVAADSPFKDAIAWAVEKGITNGTSATTFSPANTCTVRQILTFLYRAAGKPGAAEGQSDLDAAVAWAAQQGILPAGTDAAAPCTRSMAVSFMWKAAGSPAPAKTASFADVAADADYARAVSWAVEKGITNGTGGDTFSPGGTCTRGQIVTFLYRAGR